MYGKKPSIGKKVTMMQSVNYKRTTDSDLHSRLQLTTYLLHFG